MVVQGLGFGVSWASSFGFKPFQDLGIFRVSRSG